MVFFLVGNYMQMMNVLQPIAFDVLECLSQLFDYYLFGVNLITCFTRIYNPCTCTLYIHVCIYIWGVIRVKIGCFRIGYPL